MLKKDLIIGIVGATILVAAMVGVFRYEASRTAGNAFEVEWTSQSFDGPKANGVTQEGQTTATTLDVKRANLTAATFTLVWTDDVANSQPDEFQVTITSPDGVVRDATGSNGRVEVKFDNIAIQPAPQTVLAGSEAEARSRVDQQASTSGTGTWQVSIKLVNAGDLSTPVGGVPVQQDNGNSWTLESKLTAYGAKLTAQ